MGKLELFDMIYSEVAGEFDALAEENPEIISRGSDFDLTLESRLESAGYYDDSEED